MAEHQHVWSPWGRWVDHWDSLGTAITGWAWATLQGGDPVTSGWSRTCRTCGAQEER